MAKKITKGSQDVRIVGKVQFIDRKVAEDGTYIKYQVKLKTSKGVYVECTYFSNLESHKKPESKKALDFKERQYQELTGTEKYCAVSFYPKKNAKTGEYVNYTILESNTSNGNDYYKINKGVPFSMTKDEYEQESGEKIIVQMFVDSKNKEEGSLTLIDQEGQYMKKLKVYVLPDKMELFEEFKVGTGYKFNLFLHRGNFQPTGDTPIGEYSFGKQASVPNRLYIGSLEGVQNMVLEGASPSSSASILADIL